MICRIILADKVAPKGAEAATSYKKLAIDTINKTCKNNTNRSQLSKANQIEGFYIIKSNIGDQLT